MADDHAAAGDSPHMDYAEHERTYRLFLGLTKWVAIGVVVLVVGMAVTLL